MSLSFSLVMPVYDAHDDPSQPEAVRAIFTAQSALIHHQPYVQEVVIVDNNPHGTKLDPRTGKEVPISCLPGFPNLTDQRIRYVPYPEPQGTMPAKNKAVAEARCEYVCCIDAHVLLYPDFFKNLSEFFENAPEESKNDLAQGVIMTERHTVYGTHFNNQWRGQMWGTWGHCYQAPSGLLFSMMHQGDEVRYLNMPQDGSWPQRVLTKAEIKENNLPHPLKFAGHEQHLFKAGCKFYDKPFQVTGMGMGMFACRKEAWLPFHPDARGFGAEEMTTHLRFIQAGRRCWCLPNVKWWHHFERPGCTVRGTGAPYPCLIWDKVRNYVLEFRRLGLDLGPIRRHFDMWIMSDWDWQQILSGKEWPSNDGNPSVIQIPKDRNEARNGVRVINKAVFDPKLLEQ